MRPTSPEWTQPSSSIVSFVASGSIGIRYTKDLNVEDERMGVGLTLVVFSEAVGTSHADLSAWVWFIRDAVPHTWDIHQLDLVHWLGPSDSPRSSRVLWEVPRARSATFSHAIPLNEIARQRHPKKVRDLRVQGRASSRQKVYSPSDNRPDLVEHQPIPERMSVIAGLLQSLQLGSNATSEQGTLETGSFEVGRNRLVDSVEDSRYGGEGVRLEGLEVFDQT